MCNFELQTRTERNDKKKDESNLLICIKNNR
jgi:hypothetical protein